MKNTQRGERERERESFDARGRERVVEQFIERMEGEREKVMMLLGRER